MKEKAQIFKSPALYYGSLPFWSWNEDLKGNEP